MDRGRKVGGLLRRAQSVEEYYDGESGNGQSESKVDLCSQGGGEVVLLHGGQDFAVAVDNGGDGFLPGPDLAQATGHQSNQDGDGGVVVALEEPGQDLCEGDDADDGAGAD